ncbi:MAG: tRNA dihydrouridine synthase DusB [Pseudomonadota bacterium]
MKRDPIVSRPLIKMQRHLRTPVLFSLKIMADKSCSVRKNSVAIDGCTRNEQLLSPVRIGRHVIEDPVLLAPMAGITDAPFRKAVRKFGAGLVVSEMIASQELVTNRFDVRAKAEITSSDGLMSVQIAGREATWMAQAARMAEANGAEIIDINMGCPAKKVTSGYAGSALMRDLDHALTLIDSVVKSVEIPVTLKTRLGWDDAALNAAELAKRAEDAGVQMIAVHGRTRCQFYKGRANWSAVAAAKAAVSIPVIVNGDVTDARSAKEALKLSGADGVMVGRGAQGQPWVVSQIAAELKGQVFQEPSASEKRDLFLEHYSSMLDHYGVELGVRCARKHLGWMLDRRPEAAGTRAKLLRETDPERVVSQIKAVFETTHVAPTREAA